MKYKYYGNDVKDIKPINNDFPYIKSPRDLYDALSHIWSIETCAPRLREGWSKKNKTLGQCSITSMLVQDIFGGEVYGVPLPEGGYHCFNVVDGKMFDLTSEQFGKTKLTYTLDYPQSREEHFKSEEKYNRYLLLKEGLTNNGYSIMKKHHSKKIVNRVLIITGGVIGTFLLAGICYAGGILLSYSRIGNVDLKVDRKSALATVSVGETYKAMSYNIGFGAYSQDFTFFLDTGYDENDKPTCGYYSTAKSKAVVEFNTNGAIQTAQESQADFVFFQEVDTNSTRSYRINQDKKIVEAYKEYDHVHAKNFHSAFLPYPLYDMHGSVQAGLTTVSKYQIQKAERKEYTISSSLSKLFDLDRCFSVSQVKVNNDKNLWIVNSHMSAYDSGGTIRAEQVKELRTFLLEKKAANDYIVVGGDWNHDLLTYNNDYSYTLEQGHRAFGMTKKSPDWVSYWFDESHKPLIEDGFKMIASDNHPTCRNNDMEYDPEKSFVCCVDGFIVSDNVDVVSHQNIQTTNGNKGFNGFAYSDHDPAMIEFKLL